MSRRGHERGYLRSITLKQIRYFLAVAHAGSITAAAGDLDISPGAITEAVQNVEEVLGAALFERKHNGMLLTREGNRFRGYSEKILFLLDDAVSEIHDLASISGDLRLAASPAVLGYFLPAILSRFQRLFPHIHLHVLELSRHDIEGRVAQGNIDVGVLLTSNLGRETPFQMQTLLSSPRVLWCAATHPFANSEAVTLADIATEPYIQLSMDEAEENTIKFWARSGLQPQVVLRTATAEAVRGYVGQGAGVTILSEMLFRAWSLEGDRIVAKPVVDSIPTMDVGMIWLSDNLSETVPVFLDFMSAGIQHRIQKNRKYNSK